MIWTAENIARVRRLAVERLSARQIANIIGGNCSRSSVTGICRRESIRLNSIRSEAQRAGRRKKPSAPPKPKAPGLVDVRHLDIEPEAIGPLGLFPESATSCRWIAGDPRKPDWRCCGHETGGGSWCDHHAERMTVKGSQAKSTATPNWTQKWRAA